MLTGAGFGNDPVFPHAAGQDDLAQDIVNFMRACVVELVTLEIDFRAAQMLGQTLGIIQWARTSDVIGPKIIHLCPKAVIGLGIFILRFKIQDQRHQGF